MRYLLTLIVVLALASPAMSACNTTDKIVSADFDTNIIGPYGISVPVTPTDCNIANWSFEFYRTGGSNSLIIHTTVDCMEEEEPGGPNASYDSDSDDYPVRREIYTFSGDDVEITDTSLGYLRMEKSGEGTLLFKDLKLEVANFR